MDLHELIANYCVEQPTICVAVLFGSAATNRLRSDSDIDIAFLFDNESRPNCDELQQMQVDLEYLTRRDVDLILLNDASTILAYQIIKTGSVMFCRDQAAYQRFVVQLISEYADFKRIRRPIEEAVIARRIYDR